MKLYKYRSLENFKNFIDIILFNRVYAASYFELNDPMEGIYFYNEKSVNQEMVRKIKGEKEKLAFAVFPAPRIVRLCGHIMPTLIEV